MEYRREGGTIIADDQSALNTGVGTSPDSAYGRYGNGTRAKGVKTIRKNWFEHIYSREIREWEELLKIGRPAVENVGKKRFEMEVLKAVVNFC